MGFIPDEKTYGPIALPDGLDLSPRTPDAPSGVGAVLGAAFRTENPIVSALSGYDYDPMKPFDPDYRPWDDVQGTTYEPYADRFTGARDRDDVASMKLQIDRELEDRRTLDAAGAGGFMAQMGAAILSPTTLLPGGALIKGGQGVKIGMTGLNVAANAGLAASIDEVMLHASQETRTGTESAFAIGGSVILGGILGAGTGVLSRGQFKAAAQQAETALTVQNDFNELLRGMAEPGVAFDAFGSSGQSIGAARADDFRVRREAVFSYIRKVPFLRGIVRSDPILRTQMSVLNETRRTTAQLVETPMQWKINEDGDTVLNGGSSAEAAIKDRTNNQMTKAFSGMSKLYGEYWNDGAVGHLGTMTAPFQRWTSHLAGRTEKLSSGEFMNEVGRAMRRDDKHIIPQVQAAADMLRREVFEPIKDEAIDLGIFDADLKINNAASYFTRVYNQEKISQHFGDGSENDILPVLTKEFQRRRDVAQTTLAHDRTLDLLEGERFQHRETMRVTQRAFDRARKKAVGKRERAKGAITRQAAIGRATGALRRVLARRSDDLAALTLKPDERAALKDMLKDARGANRLRPRDILEEIRRLGGIKDDRVGSRWNGKDWVDGSQTDLETILDTQARTIRRKDGKDIDVVREALIETGYLDEGATVNDLLDAIGRQAQGTDVFSRLDLDEDVARWEAATAFRDEMEALGVDISKPLDDVIAALPQTARDPKIAKAKSGEAGRNSNAAGKSEDAAEAGVIKALERLEEANARLAELDGEIKPKVREEIKAAREALRDVIPKIKEARKAKDAEEFYANATDIDIDKSVREAAQSIIGLKAGEASYRAAFANPTRARVLDVADEVLEPWLQDNAQEVMASYFRSMVPDMEIIRRFGDLEMTDAQRKINNEAAAKMNDAANQKQRRQIKKERDENINDLLAMRDRLRNVYGVPANPKAGWVQGARAARTLSYMGFLGGMTLSAIPDVSNVIGRAGIRGAVGGAWTAVTDPKRLALAAKDMTELGSAADWWLNSRAIAIADMFDPYGQGTRMEKMLSKGAAGFSQATGMVAWNAGWKSVGGAMVASKMAKAADRMLANTATKSDRLTLAANGIDGSMADRIARQIGKHGDKDGEMWLPRGQNWDDREAFEAFRRAMGREMDVMIVTPGQDLPLAFSTETGKFFLQFKSFAFSAHHRILLAGIQRSDADVLAQVVTAIVMGGLVSNIKASLAGKEPKEGAAFWEDAVDRSGLAGWLMMPYTLQGALTGGKTMLGGEQVSRYQSRSFMQGMTGPSVDMAVGLVEAGNAFASDNASYRDVRKIMRLAPGNNLTWLLGLTQKIEDAAVEATGARPRN
ncbi:MAG: hypothetical protein ACPG4X_16470 [Pikeienuella sp.]